jgi:hypothetical protein
MIRYFYIISKLGEEIVGEEILGQTHAVIWAGINLLIFHTESRQQFLELVHVFRHFMRLQKDITD